tara:strand:+ start:774 stop:1490 length:717 start_codon:yes stop_codon:yes gene_type:complete
MKNLIKRILKYYGWKLIKLRKPPEPSPYSKLDINVLNSINNSNGILHLGAHRGVEAEVYNWFGKKVIWVEALPKIYKELEDNLTFFKNQKSFQAVLTNEDFKEIDFYVSNYDGACSSIYKFTENIKTSDLWSKRDHKMINSVKLKTIKLDTLLTSNNIDPQQYNHWIIDLQGSELLALKGAENSLKFCESIFVEVSKVNFYENGVIWDELKKWLNERNFYSTKEPNKDEEDILFVKKH